MNRILALVTTLGLVACGGSSMNATPDASIFSDAAVTYDGAVTTDGAASDAATSNSMIVSCVSSGQSPIGDQCSACTDCAPGANNLGICSLTDGACTTTCNVVGDCPPGACGIVACTATCQPRGNQKFCIYVTP